MRVRIARDELRRRRELTQTIKALEAEIADLVAQIAPHLLSEPGFGPLDRQTASRSGAGIRDMPRRLRQRLTVAWAIPSSDAINLGPQPVLARASQTRSWTSSLTRPGRTVRRRRPILSHAPDARSASLAVR